MLETAQASKSGGQVVYRGKRKKPGTPGEEVCVTANGDPLPTRYDLLSASPDGFEWGYSGSGPAQLSISLLADAVGDEVAKTRYQEFKRDVVADLPHEFWQLTDVEIRNYLTPETDIDTDVNISTSHNQQ